MTREATLVCGVAVTAIGGVLLLDSTGTWSLGPVGVLSAVLGVLGAILLADGLSRR